MATLETQKLDAIIASRRSLLVGATALAATAVFGTTQEAAAAVTAKPNDFDILNFALNLEYLEANFYTIAVEGVTADNSKLGSATKPPAGSGTVTFRAGAKVTFTNPAVAAYAIETALEERKHVNFLLSAIGGNGGTAVARPNINLQTSFLNLGTLLGVPGFDPFTTDLNFLLGSYIFEDVGVTAYHGGALGITNKGANGGLDVLTPAAGIHAVEAYHAGLVRTTLALFDAGLITFGSADQALKGQAVNLTTGISNLRATLDGTVGQAPAATDTVGLSGQDDFGLATYSVPTNGTTGTASRIMDQGRTTSPFYSNFIGFKRSYQQVLNIVYGSTSGYNTNSFFPNGMNGNIS
ncbi:MAG: ferritin-like domain-containing protein [Janthinobacterium lividum]